MKKILFSEAHKNRFKEHDMFTPYEVDPYLIAECTYALSVDIESIMETVNLVMFSEAKVDVGAKIKEAVKRLLGTLVKVMKYVTGMIMKFLNWILGKKKNATNVTVER